MVHSAPLIKLYIFNQIDLIVQDIKIPWQKFNEEEIQTLIAIFFHSLDYHIKELHKSDRANEKGADLVVYNDKEKIAIAIKVKPDRADCYQLIELSQRKEKRKIYVHIETPTGKFLDAMKKHGKNIEFWDTKKLTQFFIENNLYFTANIIFENHHVYEIIDTIIYFLYKLRQDCEKIKKKKFKQIDKKSFMILWRLKDMAVTLHQTNTMLLSMFEEKVHSTDLNLNKNFLSLFLNYLDALETKLNSFWHYFAFFYSKNKELVDNSIIEQYTRSHWIYLASFKPHNNLYTIKNNLEEAIKEKKAFDNLSKNLDTEFQKKKIEEIKSQHLNTNEVWEAMHHQIHGFMIVGDGLECIIDDIIKEYFGDYFILGNLKSITSLSPYS